jgi:hypothetical protein
LQFSDSDGTWMTSTKTLATKSRLAAEVAVRDLPET